MGPQSRALLADQNGLLVIDTLFSRLMFDLAQQIVDRISVSQLF